MENNTKCDTFNENSQNLFDYSISGLGQSDYENEDLFTFEPETLDIQEEKTENNMSTNSFNSNTFGYENQPFNFAVETNFNQDIESLEETENVIENNMSDNNVEKDIDSAVVEENFDNIFSNNISENLENEEEKDSKIEVKEEIKSIEEEKEEKLNLNEEKKLFESTPIEELNKLTEYTEEKVKSTDINELFDRVGVNVKEASDIFQKNTEMKAKIDARFEDLKKLQSEVEKTKKAQIEEINSYKQDVLSKLTEKKAEIEKRLNKLREYQTTLEKEKQEFEQYKKTQKEEIQKVQKEIQDAYESRREELNHIEDVLRKQKDSLDEERSKLSLDIIQYEADKNELANNLLKFNEIVGAFTNGMDKMKKE